ncbi:hypothetical protein DWF00_28945, partial [Bosea caraganae]
MLRGNTAGRARPAGAVAGAAAVRAGAVAAPVEAVAGLEGRDQRVEALDLAREGACRGGALLGQGGVLLGHLIHM